MEPIEIFYLDDLNRKKGFIIFDWDKAAKLHRMMVFDWDKAAKLIRERKPEEAFAGLKNDWEYTGGLIYRDGQIVRDTDTYLASVWAIPELMMDGEFIACYRMRYEVPNWDSQTKWPRSAVSILMGDNNA